MTDMKTLKWSTDSGDVILQWPTFMTADDATEALAAVGIACRSIQRLAIERPPFEEYERSLQSAMEPRP